MIDTDDKFVIVNGVGDRLLMKHGIMVSLDEMTRYAAYAPMFFATAEAALTYAAKSGLNQFVRAETMADFIADNAGMEEAKP